MRFNNPESRAVIEQYGASAVTAWKKTPLSDGQMSTNLCPKAIDLAIPRVL